MSTTSDVLKTCLAFFSQQYKMMNMMSKAVMTQLLMIRYFSLSIRFRLSMMLLHKHSLHKHFSTVSFLVCGGSLALNVFRSVELTRRLGDGSAKVVPDELSLRLNGS